MSSVAMLSLLRVFMTALGLFTAAWGIYDQFGDGGAQSGNGLKKIIGGVAFAIIIYLVFTGLITDVEKAESSVGITPNLYIHTNVMFRSTSENALVVDEI